MKRSVSRRLRSERAQGSPMPWVVGLVMVVGLAGLGLVWLRSRMPVVAKGPDVVETPRKEPQRDVERQPKDDPPKRQQRANLPPAAEAREAPKPPARERWSNAGIDRLIAATPEQVEELAEDLAKRRLMKSSAEIGAELNMPGRMSPANERVFLEGMLPYARSTIKVCARAARLGRANGISDLAIEQFIEACWMPTPDDTVSKDVDILEWLRRVDGK